MARLKLSPPWDIYYKQLCTMFQEDDEVKVVFDEDEMNIRMYVDNLNKADALAQLLPIEKHFGSTTLTLEIIPSNKVKRTKGETIYHDAFENNGAVDYIQTVFGIFTYVVFHKKVVQYFNDDLSDINGLCSTLYQDLAKDLFDGGDAFFCTNSGACLTYTTTSTLDPYTITTCK